MRLCLKSSFIFYELYILQLTQKMRLKALIDHPNSEKVGLEYPKYLLGTGKATHEHDEDFSIYLPSSISIVTSSEKLIDSVFPNLSLNYSDKTWMTSRAIPATTNSRIKALTEEMHERFPGVPHTFLSADSVASEYLEEQKSMELNYPQGLMNSIDTGSSRPDQEIKLKKGFIVMLLRNIRQKCGHLNGKRDETSALSSSCISD